MRRSLWLAALCFSAFALSCAYLAFYLRGGPRIIDATSYFLSARSLAAGSFSFEVPEPTAAFRGRFLLADATGHRLGVIFPPGYPLLLSLGVRLGVPLLVGPLLGALLVLATFRLALALGQDEKVAWLAALLSVCCAALRYHTADTMSHGLATLLACGGLAFALGRGERPAQPLLAGLCVGLLVATRPLSGLCSLLVCGVGLVRAPRAWLRLALGLAPGVLLLLLQQRALTGSYLRSVQLAYYAIGDGPAGCFRYGFGPGIGCRFEHGDYVSRLLPNGYGFAPALRNLVVHLRVFASDATNWAPLTLLALYGLARHARTRLGLLGAAIVAQALVYVPFYFDGDYPGGGARFLCEVIPFCQILVARAACDLRLGRWLAPASLAGFLVFARPEHELLRDREGGRPMFEPKLVAGAGMTHGLLFVGTDHGFNLGHDPRVSDVQRSLLVARFHGDAHDRDLYEALGRPPTYRYDFDLTGHHAPRLVPYVPLETRRSEAEAEWPALMDRGGAYPIHHPAASGGRALRLLRGSRASFRLRSPVDRLEVGWIATDPSPTVVVVRWAGESATTLSATGVGPRAWQLPGPPPGAAPLLSVELARGQGALDFLTAELTR